MIQPACRLAAVVLLGLSLGACEKISDSSKKEVVPASAAVAPKIVIETGSPDLAVKSWWRVFDMRAKIFADECNKRKVEEKPAYMNYYSKVAQEDMLRKLVPKNTVCELEVFERDLQEVKTESETRAIVFAKIKNVTPIPVGAEPSENEKKYRNDGFRFKYLVEKSSDGWKVSQVYRYDKMNVEYLNKDPWEPIYKSDDSPRYPSYVFLQ